MSRVYCSVRGCDDRTSKTHRFPQPQKYPELFAKWIKICENKELYNMNPMTVYNTKRVCHIHFTRNDMVANERLSRIAFPTLKLPGISLHSTENVEVPAKVPRLEVDIVASCSSKESGQVENLNYLREVGDVQVREESVLETTISKEQGGSRGLLASVSVRRQIHLSLDAKILYKQARILKRKLAAATKKNESYKKRLAEASKFSRGRMFEYLNSSMDPTRSRFFLSQISCAKKKPKGRRFSLEDKVLALALYKQSGNGYKLLSKIFALPSRRTLTKLLNRIPIEPGINEYVLNVLKGEGRNLKYELDKYCILMFDEMSISPNLSWNRQKDIIEGFEDFGYKRTNKIANHVQVFMLRSIRSKWKQPIYFNFVNGASSNFEIQRILKLLISKLKDIGFPVLATVCDQGANNVAAINNLVASTRQNYQRRNEEMRRHIFEVEKMEIVPLYDPPHLLKGLRNNMLTKDIQLSLNGEQLTGKWEHIYKAYLIDCRAGNLRIMPKITDYHVNPLKIKKMKVSCCAQVFSHSVAAALNLMAVSGTKCQAPEGEIVMPLDAQETAKILLFFDELFDSVNGHSFGDTKGKLLRRGVSHKSQHVAFWNKAIQVGKTMKYNDGNKLSVPPTVTHWNETLEGLKLLKDKLFNCGFKYMMPRTFNQDPIENFFGKIRQRGVRFTNPTAAAFIPFYKSLLVNNFTKSQSLGANCEDDESTIFISLQRFVSQGLSDDENGGGDEIHIHVPDIPDTFDEFSHLEEAALGYVLGFVSKKILPKFGKCLTCKENVLLNENEAVAGVSHSLTKLKEYQSSTKRLMYCNSNFLSAAAVIYNFTKWLFPKICHEKGFSKYIIKILKDKVQFRFTFCEHLSSLQNFIITYLCKIVIFNSIKSLNNVLSGKDSRDVRNAPPIFTHARLMCKRTLRK